MVERVNGRVSDWQVDSGGESGSVNGGVIRG